MPPGLKPDLWWVGSAEAEALAYLRGKNNGRCKSNGKADTGVSPLRIAARCFGRDDGILWGMRPVRCVTPGAEARFVVGARVPRLKPWLT